MPEETPSSARISPAFALPHPPPDSSMSAAPAPSSSTGSMPAITRHHGAAAGRHRRRTQHRRQRSIHLRRAALAGPRLGRGVQAVRTAGPAPSAAHAIFEKGLAYRDFTPAHAGEDEQSGAQGAWLFNPGMRELSREESDRRAAAGEPFALRYRVPRGPGPDCCASQTASTASSPSWPTRWKTLPCCGRMECRPTIWPRAWTMPTCASAISFAGRTT